MTPNWNTLDEQWRERHDAPQFAAYEAALDKALYEQKTPDFATLWRWARMAHFRAMQSLQNDDKAAARRHYAAGAQEAAAALRLQPNRVEGLFWHGVNTIEAARLSGKFNAMRVLSQATKEMEHAAQAQEEFHFAGPLRVLGRITHKKPLLLGGDINKAVAFFRRGLQIFPQNSTTQLYLAEALLDDQQLREARSVLTGIIEAAPDPDWRWEQARDKVLAQALLDKMNR
jgi:tetratricopeptide (TPR) repeat protein